MKILHDPYSEHREGNWTFRRKHGGTIIRLEVENLPPQEGLPADRLGKHFYAVMDIGGKLWDSLSNPDKTAIMKSNWERAYHAATRRTERETA